MRKKLVLLTVLLAACLVVSGCGPSAEQRATMTAADWTATPTQTATPTRTATPTQTVTPSQTPIPSLTPTLFDFDEAAILAKLRAIFNIPPENKAIIAPIGQYELMLLGEFTVPMPPDGVGADAFFIATQNGSEITIALVNTEAFREEVESMYAAGAINQFWYRILHH